MGKKISQRADDGELPRSKWHAQNKWNQSNRHKLKAQHDLAAAIDRGIVRRGKCEVCGSLRTDGHHSDYSKPLEVRWLCRRHHQALHAELRRAAA